MGAPMGGGSCPRLAGVWRFQRLSGRSPAHSASTDADVHVVAAPTGQQRACAQRGRDDTETNTRPPRRHERVDGPDADAAASAAAPFAASVSARLSVALRIRHSCAPSHAPHSAGGGGVAVRAALRRRVDELGRPAAAAVTAAGGDADGRRPSRSLSRRCALPALACWCCSSACALRRQQHLQAGARAGSGAGAQRATGRGATGAAADRPDGRPPRRSGAPPRTCATGECSTSAVATRPTAALLDATGTAVVDSERRSAGDGAAAGGAAQGPAGHCGGRSRDHGCRVGRG